MSGYYSLRMQPLPPAIEVTGLCRRYGPRWALIDVDLAVPAGTALLVTGRNGSGKSSLLRVLATAIHPDRGTARVAGFDVVARRDEVRRRVAYLGHASQLYEPLSVLENLQLVARFSGRPAGSAELLGLLAEVGLEGREGDPVSDLSAGLRRRLCLARVLLRDAPVVLLDEPYAQLDPQGFALVDSILARCRERGATVVLVTHAAEGRARRCEQAIRIDAGRIVARETPAGVAGAAGGEGG
jgi:heme ABC exporter ATP-binding subunit CcmA